MTRHKKYWLLSVASLVSGIILIILGMIQYIYGVPKEGINLATQQPVIIDGTQPMLFGFLLLMAGGYRIIFSKKTAEKQIKDEMEAYRIMLKEKRRGNKYIEKKMKTKRKKLEKQYIIKS